MVGITIKRILCCLINPGLSGTGVASVEVGVASVEVGVASVEVGVVDAAADAVAAVGADMISADIDNNIFLPTNKKNRKARRMNRN